MEKFDLAAWLTAGGAIAAAAVAALGVRWQWENDEPVLEATGQQLANGLVWVRVYVMRRLDRTILIHSAKTKWFRAVKIGLNTPYQGIQDGYRFTLPFQTKRILLKKEATPLRGSNGSQTYSFEVFLQPASNAIATFSIDFLVSISNRPRRKRWITVSRTVNAMTTPHIPITSA